LPLSLFAGAGLSYVGPAHKEELDAVTEVSLIVNDEYLAPALAR